MPLRHRHVLFALSLVFAALLLLGERASGLINVRFTPIDLVKAADAIVLLEGTPDVEANVIRFKTVRVLKGKDPGIAAVDVADMAADETLFVAMERKSVTALVMLGDFAAAQAGTSGEARGALQIGTGWFGLVRSEAGAYSLVDDSFDLKAVWDGGTEPLARAVDYIQKARAPVIPVAAGIAWRDIQPIGPAPGATGQPVVELVDGRPRLLFASPKGNVLLTADEQGKVTARITSHRSTHLTRVDLTGDGKPKIVSWHDGRVSILPEEGEADLVTELADVLALQPGTWQGKPALLAVTGTGPVFVAPAAEGYAQHRPLAEPIEGLRVARQLDITGDGRADLLLFTDTQLLLARGTAEGFAVPTKAAALKPMQLAQVEAADFDNDGRLDLLLAGPSQRGLTLLHGDGKGGFTESFTETGELAYHGGGPVAGTLVTDFNHDGLPDIVLLRPTGAPLAMFNRGYRTFGYSRDLDFAAVELENVKALTGSDDARARVSAAAMVDLDGDGGLDLVAVADDRLLVVHRASEGNTLGVRLTLDPTLAGPVTVTASTTERILGSVVLDSAMPQFIGVPTRGPLQLTWTLPDGSDVSKRVVVLRPTDVTVGKE